MNFEKTPMAKLGCVSQCCLEIFAFLKKAQGALATADDFLPLLIYIVTKSNPIYLISNVKFLSACLPSHMMLSDSGFFLTYIEVATQHISRLDPKQIVDISRSVESDWMELSGKEPDPDSDQTAPAATPAETSAASSPKVVSKVRTSGSQQTKLQEAAQLEADYPFLTKSVDDILEKNLVSQLLEDYKRLALADWNRRQLQMAHGAATKTPSPPTQKPKE